MSKFVAAYRSRSRVFELLWIWRRRRICRRGIWRRRGQRRDRIAGHLIAMCVHALHIGNVISLLNAHLRPRTPVRSGAGADERAACGTDCGAGASPYRRAQRGTEYGADHRTVDHRTVHLIGCPSHLFVGEVTTYGVVLGKFRKRLVRSRQYRHARTKRLRCTSVHGEGESRTQAYFDFHHSPPMPRNPHPTTIASDPSVRHPHRMTMRCPDISSRHPNIVEAVPSPIAGLPNIFRCRWGWDRLDGGCRRGNIDRDADAGDARDRGEGQHGRTENRKERSSSHCRPSKSGTGEPLDRFISPRFSSELPQRGIVALTGVNYPGFGVGGRDSAAVRSRQFVIDIFVLSGP
jgi:hypothetical protein